MLIIIWKFDFKWCQSFVHIILMYFYILFVFSYLFLLSVLR